MLIGDQVWVKRGPLWYENTGKLSRMIDRTGAKALTPGVVIAMEHVEQRKALLVLLPDCCGWTSAQNVWGGEK